MSSYLKRETLLIKIRCIVEFSFINIMGQGHKLNEISTGYLLFSLNLVHYFMVG